MQRLPSISAEQFYDGTRPFSPLPETAFSCSHGLAVSFGFQGRSVSAIAPIWSQSSFESASATPVRLEFRRISALRIMIGSSTRYVLTANMTLHLSPDVQTSARGYRAKSVVELNGASLEYNPSRSQMKSRLTAFPSSIIFIGRPRGLIVSDRGSSFMA